MIDFGNWHDEIGTPHENSPNREAPNKHIRGSKKYKEMIDRGSKQDDLKNLPFKLGKPAKTSQARRDIYHVCDYCDIISMVNKNTAGRVCTGCRQYSSVNESNTYHTKEDLVESVGDRGNG